MMIYEAVSVEKQMVWKRLFQAWNAMHSKTLSGSVKTFSYTDNFTMYSKSGTGTLLRSDGRQ